MRFDDQATTSGFPDRTGGLDRDRQCHRSPDHERSPGNECGVQVHPAAIAVPHRRRRGDEALLNWVNAAIYYHKLNKDLDKLSISGLASRCLISRISNFISRCYGCRSQSAIGAGSQEDVNMSSNLGNEIIICKDVHKWYGDFMFSKELRPLREREVVVVIGPSGSGKSTWIRTLEPAGRAPKGPDHCRRH